MATQSALHQPMRFMAMPARLQHLRLATKAKASLQQGGAKMRSGPVEKKGGKCAKMQTNFGGKCNRFLPKSTWAKVSPVPGTGTKIFQVPKLKLKYKPEKQLLQITMQCHILGPESNETHVPPNFT